MAGAWYDNDTGIPAAQIDAAPAPAAQPTSATGNWYDNAQGVPAEQIDKVNGTPPAQAPTAQQQKPMFSGLGKAAVTMNALPAGITNSIANTALGASDLAAYGANKVGLMPDKTYQNIHGGIGVMKDVKDEDTEQALKANPAGQGLNVAGNLIGDVGQFAAGSEAAPVKAAATLAEKMPVIGAKVADYLPSAVTGAATSGLQPVQDQSDRLINAGIGAGAGIAGKAIGNTLSTQITDPAKQAALKTAEDFNIPVYRSQVSDNPVIQAAASFEKNVPGSGVAGKLDAQTAAFNKAVNGRLGIDSNTLNRAGDKLGVYGNIVGPEALDAADHKISQTYNTITGKYNLTANQPFNDALTDIEKDGAENLVDSKASAFKQQINNIRKKIVNATSGGQSAGNGIIPGPIYQNLRSNISGIMRSGNGSPQLGKVLNLLDTQMAKGMTPEDASAFQAVRGQYKNMLVAEKAVKIDPNNPVTPARIAQGARNAFSDYAYGSQSDFAHLGRLGAMLGDKGANTSKTAIHNQFYDVLKHAVAPAIGAGFGAGEGYHTGGVEGGFAGAALGAAGALGANRLGATPFLYSKMSTNPSMITKAAPATASAIANEFLNRHKKQTNQ